MCGICGFAFPTSSRRVVDAAVLRKMRDELTHRGPDDAGMYVDSRVGLGHRRLSIIDVAHGHQPMADDSGSLQIVYNGEVFNHVSLRQQLEQRGVTFRTRCDTEAVLRLFQHLGAETPNRLRGMFAFAVWNAESGELFLARDRLGVKPLYYALADDGAIYFGSEIKAILASGAVRPELEHRVLPDYLANHAPSGELTMFAGVRRLMPGHTLMWRDGHVSIRRYWDLSFSETSDGDDNDLVGEYADRLRESVRLRLMSDVPIGTFLSGGIDSAAITAVTASLIDQPVNTFSVAFAEREANELQYARLVANRYRTKHREVVVTPAEFFRELPKLVWHEDEPIAHPSSVALYFVSRLAAQHVKVVLTGEGSDETLAGYGRYRSTVYNTLVGSAYQRLTTNEVRHWVRSAIDRLPARARLRHKIERTFLYLPADLDHIYFDNFAVFSRALQADMLAPAMQERLRGVDAYASANAALARTDARSVLDRLLYVDVVTYLHELLMKQDQMSMAASIESRVPFLDHPLVEFTARLPQRLKFRRWTTKYVLREAMRGVLPEEILTRKKMGFPVPIGRWFRGHFRAAVTELVSGDRAMARGLFRRGYVESLLNSHVRGDRNRADQLWALMNLELWHRLFIDGESSTEYEWPDRALVPAGATE